MSQSRSNAARETVDRVQQALGQPTAPQARSGSTPATGGQWEFDFTTLPEYEIMKIWTAVGDITNIGNPFYRLHDGRAGNTTSIDGRVVANFSSYDYLGLNGHPDVSAAAKAAIDRFGTSMSASRLSAGERQVHRDLEAALARLSGTEEAVAFVSGHETNGSVIGELLGPQDLVVADAVIHNSIVEGAKLSGAKRTLCPHNDLDAFELALRLNRARYRRTLIVVEGLYGMDGDLPDLAGLIKLKRRCNAWLMVDEAHATGALGRTGRGIAEEQDNDPAEVEIWMGTPSKTLAAAGGYIPGSRALIDLIKYTSPGLVFSVDLSPPAAAAATAEVDVMMREPWRAAALRRNGLFLLKQARRLDTGLSIGASVVPVIVGNSPQTAMLPKGLLECGFNVVPAVFPGVAENQAQLRLFVTSEHTPEQIANVIGAVAEELPKIRNGSSFVSTIAGG